MRREIQDAAEINSQGHHMLSEEAARRLARAWNIGLKEIYERSLALGIWPERYVRNAGSLTTTDQGTLLHKRVAVAGCGGLGGYISQFLTRMGVGELRLFDPDRFEASNLNRQLFASEKTLGALKAEAAREALTAINPATQIEAYPLDINSAEAHTALTGVDLIADGLDSLAHRARLFEQAKEMGVPMVHATIAGFEAQVMVLWPDGPAFGDLFGRGATATAEETLGTPAVTPAVAAGFQCTQIIRALLGTFPHKSATMVHIDLLTMETDTYRF